MRTVRETEGHKQAQQQGQNDAAIGELSIMMAQMQEQNDAAIGELSMIVAQMMTGGTENGI